MRRKACAKWTNAGPKFPKAKGPLRGLIVIARRPKADVAIQKKDWIASPSARNDG